MSEAVKITILMPSLNVKTYIRECMDSVVGQSMKELEILCIDAGSTDGTWEILQEYADRDSRIRLLRSDRRSYGFQINMGLKAAKGEYIGIVETDDYIDPDMYRKLYRNAEQTGKPDIVKAAFWHILSEEEGGIVPEYAITAGTGEVFPLTAHEQLLSGHPSIWSCIYKKSFLDQKNIRMKECPGGAWVDNPFLYRTMCEAEQICWVNEPLYYYRETNPDASSRLKDCSIPFDRINEMKDYLEENYPGNLRMEKHLFYRTALYIKQNRNNPNLTRENKKQILNTVRRFKARTILRVFAGYQYKTIKKLLKRQGKP